MICCLLRLSNLEVEAMCINEKSKLSIPLLYKFLLDDVVLSETIQKDKKF
jgi:hypothetical protein